MSAGSKYCLTTNMQYQCKKEEQQQQQKRKHAPAQTRKEWLKNQEVVYFEIICRTMRSQPQNRMKMKEKKKMQRENLNFNFCFFFFLCSRLLDSILRTHTHFPQRNLSLINTHPYGDYCRFCCLPAPAVPFVEIQEKKYSFGGYRNICFDLWHSERFNTLSNGKHFRIQLFYTSMTV